MKQLLSLPLILSLCFTGCKTIDTVQRTQVGHEDTWISTSVSTDPVTQDWWRIFDDPVLESLIEEAVIANFDIKIAQARIREARATRDA
ncbi:MAG: RND transporter, partial [Verrucomicrobiota bacterium]